MRQNQLPKKFDVSLGKTTRNDQDLRGFGGEDVTKPKWILCLKMRFPIPSSRKQIMICSKEHCFFWVFQRSIIAITSHPFKFHVCMIVTKPKMECKCQARPETTLVAPGAVSSSPSVRPGQYGGFYFGYLRICSNMFKHV